MRGTRRAARELALNILYQWDACGVPFDEALETAVEMARLGDLETQKSSKSVEAKDYARHLAEGVVANIKEIDLQIGSLATGWPLDRQPAVDRNILRMAIFEIKYVDTVPAVVAVDEAVELAKKYSTAESGKFVNGVLAGYLKAHQYDLEANVGSKDTRRSSPRKRD